METYIKKLWKHIEDNPTIFDENSDYPALESLYWHYCESHNMTNENIKAANRGLDNYMETLPFQEKDKVFSLVCALCAEYERMGFLAGIQLGVQMMLEIEKCCHSDQAQRVEESSHHSSVGSDHYFGA